MAKMEIPNECYIVFQSNMLSILITHMVRDSVRSVSPSFFVRSSHFTSKECKWRCGTLMDKGIDIGDQGKDNGDQREDLGE